MVMVRILADGSMQEEPLVEGDRGFAVAYFDEQECESEMPNIILTEASGCAPRAKRRRTRRIKKKTAILRKWKRKQPSRASIATETEGPEVTLKKPAAADVTQTLKRPAAADVTQTLKRPAGANDLCLMYYSKTHKLALRWRSGTQIFQFGNTATGKDMLYKIGAAAIERILAGATATETKEWAQEQLDVPEINK